MSENSINNEWWGQLKHGGMLISPNILKNTFTNLKISNSYSYEIIRDRYLKYKANMEQKQEKFIITEWIDYLFLKVLKYSEKDFIKGNGIEEKYRFNTILGKKLYPDRMIKYNENPIMLIKICEDKIIGVGKGKRNFADFLELLRENKDVNLGIITNGDQIRLCYVDNECESWTEWNIENWFIEEEYRNQFRGFITLLAEENILPLNNGKSILISAIENSRKSQGELSSVLGEQIREAVEILIGAYETTVKDNNIEIETLFGNTKSYLDSIYQAASKIIMRLVVIFFAESRQMLPIDIQAYNDSYGLEGLYEELKKACAHEGRNELKNHYEAWRRILSLFKLIYYGSGHNLINLQAYGGELFNHGDINSNDDISKVLSIFENQDYRLSDFQVLTIIEKLKIGKVKVKQGKKEIWVNGPVDFSQIRTEYIGIMYEGLLDYSLNRANATMIVLNIGDEPILPLYHLEMLTDDGIKKLYKGYKSDTSEDLMDEVDDKSDVLDENFELSKVTKWLLRVVKILNLVNRNRIKDDYEYKKQCYLEARKLKVNVYEKDDYYLIKAGGIRKGTGTYYTKPGLTVPTVERTLKPLVHYENDNKLIPKEPEKILALKVCDPACGSGSFLVAATEYLSNVLTKSMIFYKRFEKKSGDQTRIMPYATRSKGLVEEETLSVAPDSEDFEEHLKSRLMRYVVERCIYGVDINPMAVELARLSLWIETMNDELPFTFLDHKIKVGNSLIGTTLNNFNHYPILAFEREGGDKEHNNGVRYKKKEWTKIIKDYYKNIIKSEMISVLESYEGINQLEILPKEIVHDNSLENTVEEVTELFEQFHRIPLSASGIRKRELMYKEKIIGNDAIIKLKFEFDKWCSIWFWPIDKLDLIPTPRTFKNLSLETTQEIKNIAKEQKFFHWELEFPDVFAVRQSGFDAIITNPPWNIEKPNSVEFFSYYDPLYSTYGKQEAVRQQNRLYQENSEIEYEWLKNNLNNKAMSNWVKNSYNPFGYDEKCNNIVTLTNKKTENRSLHQSWALKRNNDRVNKREMLPFYLQGGSDINLYKLFVEESCYLINKNGRLAMIVPSGIYSDKGTKELRKYFLNNFNWEWVFSFENRNRIFDIHGSFKFSIIILQKNKKFEYIKTAFMVRDIEAWQKLNIDILKYYKTSIIKFSPNNMALLEFEHQKDIDIINKIYNSEKQEIDINTSREFDMTNDSKLFKTQVELIDKEYRTDKFGRMIKGNDVYYPLYQGTMINQLNFADKKWSVENEKWEKNDNMKIISSQYYINKNYSEFKYKLKFQYRSISNATNNRTLIGAITPYYPSGNSLNKVIIEGDDSKYILLGGIMSSFVYDYILRNKMIGTNLNSFILKEIPLTKIDNNIQDNFLMMCASLQLNHYIFAPQWIELRQKMKGLNTKCLYKLWAVSNHERMRLRAIVEAIVAYSYGVSFEDLDYILRDDESNAKGFWRVDKEKPKEVRLTTLSLEAYKDLLDRGINEFINDEWQLPKVAADYYGTQYLEWQLEKTAEESWQDCEQYAKEFLGEDEFEKFMSDLKEMEMK